MGGMFFFLEDSLPGMGSFFFHDWEFSTKSVMKPISADFCHQWSIRYIRFPLSSPRNPWFALFLKLKRKSNGLIYIFKDYLRIFRHHCHPFYRCYIYTSSKILCQNFAHQVLMNEFSAYVIFLSSKRHFCLSICRKWFFLCCIKQGWYHIKILDLCYPSLFSYDSFFEGSSHLFRVREGVVLSIIVYLDVILAPILS